jgi:hypothetical protein
LLGLVFTPNVIPELVCAVYFAFREVLSPFNLVHTCIKKKKEERKKKKAFKTTLKLKILPYYGHVQVNWQIVNDFLEN